MPALTKQHFEMFAAYIKGDRNDYRCNSDARQAQADMIVALGKQSNPRFNEARFLKACNLYNGAADLARIQDGLARTGSRLLRGTR